MSQMLSRIVRSLIFWWRQSYLSGLSHSNSTSAVSPVWLSAGHSTETAVRRVLSDLQAVNSEDVAALVLSDLSAASDTVDHALLGRRLRMSCGLVGSALAWFHTYLRGRSQYVRRGALRSSAQLICGVPQGSVHGSYTLYYVYWRPGRAD